MPTTRAASRAAVMSIQNLVDGPPPAPAVQEAPAPPTNGKKGKRKASGEPKTSSRTSKRANKSQDVNANGEVKPEMNLITQQEAESSGLMLPPPPVPDESRTFVPAQLTFPLEKARAHLIGVDPRFEDIFINMVTRILPLKKGTVAADRIIKFVGGYIKFANDKCKHL